MTTFDILRRESQIHRNILLEASAGTGKTFTIEHLYVRLLIEEPIKTVDEILVVTFTKKATSELKERIRAAIVKALSAAVSGDNAFDFLNAVDPEKTKRRLQHALSDFDDAMITTIHAFCERSLKENHFVFDEASESMRQLAEKEELRKAVHDYFLTGLKKERVSPAQLQIVLNTYRSDVRKLENALLNLMSKGLQIIPGRPFQALFDDFSSFMKENAGRYDAEKLIEDFETLAPRYKETCIGRSTELKPEIREAVEQFCALFNQNSWSEKDFEGLLSNDLIYATKLDDSKPRSKTALHDAPAVHYPDFVKTLREGLLSTIQEARHPGSILALMAHDGSDYLNKYLQKEEKYRFDDLLANMLKRVSGEGFAEKMRSQYSAVVIDEFQDTDPIQWKIFKTLFVDDPKKRAHLYLVGDPKQSIYAFRRADIYTYLSAANTLGNDAKAVLSTNFRSEAKLVETLNALFSEKNIPHFFPLPRIRSSLSCPQVIPAKGSESDRLSDGKGAIHLLLAEGSKKGKSWPSMAFRADFFMRAVVNEMIRCKERQHLAFSSWAILVKDRHEADEFYQLCLKAGVPARKQKGKKLIDSPAFDAIKQLCDALESPHDLNAFKIMLGGDLVRFSPQELESLKEIDILTEKCSLWKRCVETASRKGFSLFVTEFLRTKWNNKDTLYETLIREEAGLLDEFQQICDLIGSYQYQRNGSIHHLKRYLNELEPLSENDDSALTVFEDKEQEACEIVTIHSSKGLEYDRVVPLGLITRTVQKEECIPMQDTLVPVVDENSNLYKQYQEERDAEKMRQFYVAMTRAKHRIYLPIAIEKKGLRQVPQGDLSPMELFLNAFKPCLGDPDAFLKWCDTSSTITYEWLPEKPKLMSVPPEREKAAIKAPKAAATPRESLQLHSFTSLSRASVHRIEGAPQDDHHREKNRFTLPSGRETGVLLHEILEKIDYEKVKHAECPRALESDIFPFIKQTAYEDWKEVIARLIFTTLKKTLSTSKGKFRLCDVPSEQRFHEVEFLYPRSEGLLKGVIDLVFAFNGAYFIVDWKGNWLGASESDYRPEALKKTMEQHDYTLQEAIYREAVKRYLRPFETRPFEECYGGSYYFFLRGLNFDNDNGVAAIWTR